jgi:hypothetical protein
MSNVIRRHWRERVNQNEVHKNRSELGLARGQGGKVCGATDGVGSDVRREITTADDLSASALDEICRCSPPVVRSIEEEGAA